MDQSEAVDLIKAGMHQGSEGHVWADLGCGGGTFTLALATLLSSSSHLYAVDQSEKELDLIPEVYKDTNIEKICLNFVIDTYPFDDVDGILMANSLHYVNDKFEFLQSILPKIKTGGSLIVVEYEARYSNPWVPYPINQNELMDLLDNVGFKDIQQLGQMKSRYGHLIYSVGCKNASSIDLQNGTEII